MWCRDVTFISSALFEKNFGCHFESLRKVLGSTLMQSQLQLTKVVTALAASSNSGGSTNSTNLVVARGAGDAVLHAQRRQREETKEQLMETLLASKRHLRRLRTVACACATALQDEENQLQDLHDRLI